MGSKYTEKYTIVAGDYACAGEVSAHIKMILKKLHIPSGVVRRVAVASYEAEMNTVIHSKGGKMILEVTADDVLLLAQDVGPGIPDLELAMSEGWSTASEDVRKMGFGAGMGLPNMKRNSDDFSIESEVGVGTRIEMRFYMY